MIRILQRVDWHFYLVYTSYQGNGHMELPAGACVKMTSGLEYDIKKALSKKKKSFIPNFYMTSEYKACVISSKAYILHLCFENSINPETGLLMP